MIISHKYKFIFLRTKKTAGSSLEVFLSQFCGPKDIITLDDAEAEKMKLEKGVLSKNYLLPFFEYKINDWKIFLRNLSRKKVRYKYYNHMNAEELKNILNTKIWNDYYIFCFERNPYEKALSAYLYHLKTYNLNQSNYSFDIFLDEHDYYKNFHRYTINGKIAVDQVYDYKNINNSIDKLLKRIGIYTKENIPHAKAHNIKRVHYSKYFDENKKNIVFNNCKLEIEKFGYNFEQL